VVPFEHQKRSAIGAVCAVRPVHAVVRTFPRARRAHGRDDPIGPAAQQGGRQRNLAVQSEQAKPKQAPAKQDNDQNGPDGCAICAVIAMAGSVLSASPPILLLPEAVEFLHRTTDAEFLHLKSAGTAFQPRAPPAS